MRSVDFATGFCMCGRLLGAVEFIDAADQRVGWCDVGEDGVGVGEGGGVVCVEEVGGPEGAAFGAVEGFERCCFGQ
jgi:hypothetical protein